MGVRIYYKINKYGLHDYYKEEWEYKRTVDRKSSKATLGDIIKHGKLEHILETLSYLSIIPIKSKEDLTNQQFEAFISRITLLELYSQKISGISRLNNLDPIESLTLCYRKAFSNVIDNWEISEERAVGIPITKLKHEDLIMEVINNIRITEVAKLSKIDDKFRVTLPRLYTKMLGWNIGTEVLIVPHETEKYGNGFLISTKGTLNKDKINVEVNIGLLTDFVKQISDEITPNNLKNLIEQGEAIDNSLPKELANWFSRVLH